MPYTLYNYSQNSLEFTNTDLGSPLRYTFYFLDVDGFFSPVESYPSDPTVALAAGATVTIDFTEDNIYKLVLEGTPNTEYFFLLDYNLRVCKKEKIQPILCSPCADTNDPCVRLEYIKSVDDYMKFKVLSDIMYWVYSKYVQQQSVTDIIVPPTGEILYLSDLKEKLSALCSGCCNNSCGCSSCEGNTSSSSSSTSGGCGCS